MNCSSLRKWADPGFGLYSRRLIADLRSFGMRDAMVLSLLKLTDVEEDVDCSVVDLLAGQEEGRCYGLDGLRLLVVLDVAFCVAKLGNVALKMVFVGVIA